MPEVSANAECKADWMFGAAARDITPGFPVILAGYLRDEPTREVRNPIHCKAAYFRAGDGSEALILNADVVGLSRASTRRVARALQKHTGIPPAHMIQSATHNHSGPLIRGVLEMFNEDACDLSVVSEYTDFLEQRMIECALAARADAQACAIVFGSGVLGMGVNRRRAAPHLRHLPTVVDQDVPVITAWNPDGKPRGILFGYACHTTVMFDNVLDGDYSGRAQALLEKEHPEAVAMFLAGCGGDINPLPRRSVELNELYGRLLAAAVRETMRAEGGCLQPEGIRGAMTEIMLPLREHPEAADLEAQLEPKALRERVLLEQFRPMPPEHADAELGRLIEKSIRFRERKVGRQLELCRNGAPAAASYPVQVLQLAPGLRLVALAGEPVADYSLRIKERLGFLNTWPMGYCNDLTAYIPSRRVLEEGGYEGTGAMIEFGFPSPFCSDVEDLVLNEVERLAREMAEPPAKAGAA